MRRVLFVAVFFVSLWAMLGWGFPWIEQRSPALCARWALETGICGERVMDALRGVNRWTREHIFPFSRRGDPSSALERASAGLDVLEGAARRGAGDAAVDAATRAAGRALEEAGSVLGTETARGKLADVPANASALLEEARRSFDHLRSLLAASERRAEEVSGAVSDTRRALDALSRILPDVRE